MPDGVRVRRVAGSLRTISARYGIDRSTLARGIARGELRAARLGRRRVLVFFADVERWLRRYGINRQPESPDAE